ncbi:MAG: flippase-like domain-containing protein [Chloroflexi bacterium]|nr:flippase-like domain-containing protein [Chloroflexota bacterium]
MKLGSWLGIAISIVLVIVLLRIVNLDEMLAALGTADYRYVLLAMVLVIATFWLKAVRWRVLLAPVGTVSTADLFSAVTIGMMANNLLPARAGEVIRAVVVGRREGIGFSAAFATVVVERVFDGFMVLVLLLGVVVAIPLPDEIRIGGWMSALLYGGVLVGLLSFSFFRPRIEPWLALLLRPFPVTFRHMVLGQLDRFASGLLILRDPRRIASTLLLSALLWVLFGLILEILLRAFALDIPPTASAVLLLTTALGVTVPSGPAYVGLIQWAFVIGLGLFGVSESAALGISLVFHAANFLPNTLPGLVFLGRESLGLGQLASLARGATHAPPTVGAEPALPSFRRKPESRPSDFPRQ